MLHDRMFEYLHDISFGQDGNLTIASTNEIVVGCAVHPVLSLSFFAPCSNLYRFLPAQLISAAGTTRQDAAMVVLAVSILHRNRGGGKVLLSRQFVEMTKVRTESLLQAFPKLISDDSQHTFVETDQVRTLGPTSRCVSLSRRVSPCLTSSPPESLLPLAGSVRLSDVRRGLGASHHEQAK